MMVLMDDSEIIASARAYGFALLTEEIAGCLMWGWRQDGAPRRPRFADRRHALDYMQDRLQRLALNLSAE